MPQDTSSIVSKVWNYAHVLKNAGVGYGDYIEQITYLLFLKLAEEREELGYDNPIPDEYQWPELVKQSGDDLKIHYRDRCESFGKQDGQNFRKRTYEELIARDYRVKSDMNTRAQANLDILWLKDDSLEDSENLPPPAELAEEIIASLETALEKFRGVEDALKVEE